jgi:geranylgeranyl diphosphate synthase type II
MYSIEHLSDIIDKALRGIEIPSEPSNLYAPIRFALASGGKRLRPVFTLAACNAFSPTIDAAIYPALAIEVFHNFTLVHDDIMDNAPLRRNQPTVFAKWGQNMAILSGDAMNVLAYQLLGRSSKENLPRIFNTFNEVALGVCEGQQMDMDFEKAHYVTQEEYLRMIELKTAILLKGALQIGAIIGGASQSDIDRIGVFGKNLGLAFQIQDDLLDTYGSSHTFGKRIGGDIVANKKTFLTVMGFSLAKGKQLELLNSYFKAENIEPEKKIEGVKKIYDAIEIKALTEKIIEDYFRAANAALENISIKPEQKQTLAYLSKKVMDRKN